MARVGDKTSREYTNSSEYPETGKSVVLCCLQEFAGFVLLVLNKSVRGGTGKGKGVIWCCLLQCWQMLLLLFSESLFLFASRT